MLSQLLAICQDGTGGPSSQLEFQTGWKEGQWDPGVHQEEGGQQVEGGSPSPLLCPGEAPSAVLCPVLGSPVQER